MQINICTRREACEKFENELAHSLGHIVKDQFSRGLRTTKMGAIRLSGQSEIHKAVVL